MPLRVRVQNFQSIEDGEIIIDGLTVITGTNNAGKSALFRAIRGNLTNTRGTFFVRQGKSHSTVDIEDLETKDLVVWEKGHKGTNRYTVNGKVFDRVGHGVPPEAQLFGVSPIQIGDSELWPQIAPQITGVIFLLDQTGSVIAEAVADVKRVQQLNKALKSCESDRRSTRADLKLRKKDSTTLQERHEQFAGLDVIVEDLDAIDQEREKADKVVKALGNLVKLGERYAKAQGEVEALEGLEEVEGKLPSDEVVQTARETAHHLAKVRDLSERYETTRTAVEALEGLDQVADSLPTDEGIEYARKFRQALQVSVRLAISYEEAEAELDQAEKAQEAAEEITLDEAFVAKAEKIKKALGRLRGLGNRYDAAKEALADLDGEIESTEKGAEESKGIVEGILGTYTECPTCGGTLDHVH